MVNWDKFFGSTSAVKETEKTSQGVEVQKNPSMMTMLIPWITFWIAVSVNTEKGFCDCSFGGIRYTFYYEKT